MKRQRAIAMAKEIGDMHYQLIHFDQLPKTASKEQQLEALRQDQRWQEQHQTEMNRHIDNLMTTIEYGND